MKKIAFIFAFLGLYGCALNSPIPLSEITPVHLCYELVTSNQKRGVDVFREIQRRGENCDNYQQQVAMMIQAENQRRAALGAALSNLGNQVREDQKGFEESYWAPQRALRTTSPQIKCTSQQGLGGVINTTCR